MKNSTNVPAYSFSSIHNALFSCCIQVTFIILINVLLIKYSGTPGKLYYIVTKLKSNKYIHLERTTFRILYKVTTRD